MAAEQQSASQTSSNSHSADVFDISRWQPLDAFLNANPQFNLGQIRWLLRNKEDSGFVSCIKKIGRRYYIHDQLFAQWIMKQD